MGNEHEKAGWTIETITEMVNDWMAFEFILEKLSLRYIYFCFIDTKEYLADAIFIKYKVRVWFQKEAHNPNTNFVFIFCKIMKKDINKFLEALKELNRKMILSGYSDYHIFCKEFCQKCLVKKEKT